jgi:RHS repeat-associated protein
MGSFTMPVLKKLITYSYDEIGRMTEKRYMPDGTFSLGNPDYIYLPPSPSGTTENLARKAVILEPGTLIEPTTTGVYLAGIDSTVSDIPPFSSLQRQRYSWHIRGGLQGINLNSTGSPVPDLYKGDLFSYKLDYEAAGQWSGNIGRQSWNHVNGTEAVGVRNYLFTYDQKNQLKSAIFSGLPGENYSLPNINYDKNSNIVCLQRNGKKGSAFGLMDNLTYSYFGNRLASVNDAVSGDHEVDFVKRGSGAYTYWENGAMKSDENKEITNIIYNTFLNLPAEIQLTGSRWVKMTYDGSGALIKREFSTGEYWEYAHGTGGVPLIFKNGQFFSFGIPEGRAVYENGAWQLEFFYLDHLQNTRVTFRAEGNRLVKTDATDFDATGVELFGLGMESTPENLFKFQGKEKIKELGWYNFGARMYSPEIGRFMSVDGLASDMPAWSPYNAFLNNPLRYIDPDGNAPMDIILLGKNNSGITVKTDLVNLTLNVGGLGVDFGGNYTLSGRDVLQAAVDIGGVFDPTGALNVL